MTALLSRPKTDLWLLRRPIWTALTTRHADLALDAGTARLYPGDISPFCALDPQASPACASLPAIVREQAGSVAFMQADPVGTPPGLVCTGRADGVQMLLQERVETPDCPEALPLLPMDVPEMLRLVALTEPGPFGARTHLLGAYWGIRLRGDLVAMAGERLRLPGYCEISAVCVHPDHRGKGLARRLVAHVARGILARGEVPFLHAFADNRPAIALYASMGFGISQPMHIATMTSL